MVKIVYRYTLNINKQKSSKAIVILVQYLTELNSYISKSLKGLINGNLVEASWSNDLITSLNIKFWPETSRFLPNESHYPEALRLLEFLIKITNLPAINFKACS